MSRPSVSTAVVLGLSVLFLTVLGREPLPGAEKPAEQKADRPATKAPDRQAASSPHEPTVIPHGAAPRISGSSDMHHSDRALITTETPKKTPARPAPKKGERGGRVLVGSVENAVGEAAIERALAQPTTIESSDTPLADVIAYLRQFHHIHVEIDARSLEDVGVATDTPITRQLRGISLRSALDLILRDLGLVWTIHSEVLLITSPEAAEAEALLTTKCYEVGDLVICRDEKDHLWDDYDTLVDLVQNHVRADSWLDAGGAGTVDGMSVGGAKVLVVTHQYSVQLEVRQLLKELREQAAKTKGDGKPPLRPRPKAGDMSGRGALGRHSGMGGAAGGSVGGKP